MHKHVSYLYALLKKHTIYFNSNKRWFWSPCSVATSTWVDAFVGQLHVHYGIGLTAADLIIVFSPAER